MKRKNVKELVRVQTLIENDRLNVGKGVNELLLSDLSKLLTDYFDFNDMPEIVIQKMKDKYMVKVTFYPTRIKAFNCLPSE